MKTNRSTLKDSVLFNFCKRNNPATPTPKDKDNSFIKFIGSKSEGLTKTVTKTVVPRSNLSIVLLLVTMV